MPFKGKALVEFRPRTLLKGDVSLPEDKPRPAQEAGGSAELEVSPASLLRPVFLSPVFHFGMMQTSVRHTACHIIWLLLGTCGSTGT